MPASTATLSHLHRADGSATYSANGYSIVGAVNGPIEVQRRDEESDKATVEVNVRPATGVGSTRERHLESIIRSTLEHIILVHEFPRTLIQLTLQIIGTPEVDTAGVLASSYLPVLPALLQTSFLTLLSASIPMSTTLTSTLIVVTPDNKPLASPNQSDVAKATSLHVFAFSKSRKLLVDQSEGDFDMDVWDEACSIAEEVCCGSGADGMDAMEHDAGPEDLRSWLKSVAREKVEREQRWREGP